MSDSADSEQADRMELYVLRQKENVYTRAINQLERRLDAADTHMTECLQTTRVSLFVLSVHSVLMGLFLGCYSRSPTQS